VERERKHFIAGGGDPSEFERYQQIRDETTEAFRRQAEDGKYFVCGSGHIYIIKGRKPKRT